MSARRTALFQQLSSLKTQKFDLLRKLRQLHQDSRFAKAAANRHFDHDFTTREIDNVRHILSHVENQIAVLEVAIANTP